MKTKSNCITFTCAAAMLLAPGAGRAWAAALTRIWDGGSATSGNWTAAANWQGNAAPVAGDFLYFPAGAARLINTNNFATNTTFARISFEGDNYNVYGNPLTLTNGITALAGADGNVFRPNIRLGRALTINGPATSLQLTLLGNIDLDGRDLELSSTGELICDGGISGTGNVTKRSSGRTVFSGFRANTYVGDTTVVGGILELNKSILLNGTPVPRIAVPGDLVIGGGSGPLIGHAVLCRLRDQIAANAEVTINQTGELNLNGYNNTILSLRLEGGNVLTGTGTLSVTDSNIFCQRVGSEDTDPDGSFIHGRLNLAGGGPKFFTVFNTGSRLTVSAVITGAPNASITKLGNGELVLTSANTYDGPTIIREGTLRVSASGALGSGTNGVTVQGAELILLNSTITGKSLTVRKQGTPITTEGLTSTWNGNVVLEDFIGVDTRGTSRLVVNGGISGAGGYFKRGTGFLQLTGVVANTYSGFTRAAEGEVTLSKVDVVAIPGAMSVGEGAGLPAMVRAAYVGGGVLMPDQIADSAAIEVRATGQLIIQHLERIGSLAGAGALQLTSELEVGFNNISTEFSGAITGPSGELSKIGAGTLTLSGNSAHDMSRVQEGALLINGIHGGSVNVWSNASLGGNGTIGAYLLMQGGTMNPGASPGQLKVNGDVQPASAPSVFRFELNGTAMTFQDQLVVAGMVNLAGISLEVIPAMAFAPNSQFTIINKQGGGMLVASPFDGLPEGATLNAGGQVFQITYQGGNGNDVVLTRGASLISFGLPHTTLGLASLTPGPLGSLIVGNISSSGEDGVFIPLGDAQGWQGQLTALDPSTGQGRLSWEIQGQRGNLPLQPVTRGYMEVTSGEIRAFADSSAVGAHGHWVEVFAGSEFAKSAFVPSNAPLFRLLPPFTNPPAMTLRCEGPFPGKPYWSCDIFWSEPCRVVVPGGDDSPVEGATRVRVSPVPPQGLAPATGPSALRLTAKDISEIRIGDEALLNPPTPADEGLPHRALGQARFEARGGQLLVTNIGLSGADGVSIDAAGRSSGIGILTAPISLTPIGTMIALGAVGTFDGMSNHSMGTARLRTLGATVQAMADFTPVGSAMVRVEVFRGSNRVGSAMAPAGLVATMASPIGQGGAPSLDAVGWVPPGLLPVIDGIAQTAFEPLPCYFFHFDGLAMFAMQDGQQFVGDSLRVLTANDQPRAQSLARFDIRAALMAPNSSVALNVEKLRLPAPEISRVFPLQARSGELVEIRGRGFGNDLHDLSVVGSARIAGLEQLTVPFHVLSASDTRILARVGYLPPGTPGGPIRVYRGVGNEGTPQVADSTVEFIRPIRAWREGTPSSSFTLEAVSVYQTPNISSPPEWCFQSGPPVQGVLCLYLYEWFPNAVVSFSSHVSAAFTSGSASVDAFGVRFLGGGDLLEGARRLAKVLEAAFAQQAGLIVNAEATRPQVDTVKLTLSLPSGFITSGFLNVCVKQGEIVPSVAEVFPPVLTEGDLVTINGQGFGDDTRDLRVGLRDGEARLVPMQVLRATDTQIFARMGPAPPDFTQGPVEVMRGQGYQAGLATVWEGFTASHSLVAATVEPVAISRCTYSSRNSSAFPPWEDLDEYLEPHLLLIPAWDYAVAITIRALVHSFPPASTAFEKTFYLPANNHWQDNAGRIADEFEAMVGEAGFVLRMGLDGVTVNDPDPPNPQPVRFVAYMTPRYWGGPPAVMGSFSICVRASPTDIQIGRATAAGGFVTISGSGFGNEAGNLNVAIMDGGGTRLIPLDVVAASDTELTARMGTVPPDAQPGPILVTRGMKSFNAPQPFFDDAMIGPAWTWLGRGTTAVSAELVTLVPTQPETGRQWFFSGSPGSGELSVLIEGDWPNGAVVSIAAGIHDTNGAAYELNVPTARFAQAGNPVDCAERIADVIRSGFWQQAALAVAVRVTTLPGGKVKLSLSLLDGFIARGFVTIGIIEPPVIAAVQTPSGGPGDLVTIAGRGFGSDTNDLLVYVQGSNGVPTLLQVLSVNDTQIVARVGIVRPDAQGGRIVVARGQGDPFQKVVPGLQLQQFFPDGISDLSDAPFVPIQALLSSNIVCFFSAATNGVICVEVEGDWPQNVRVFLEFQFYPEGPPPSGVYGAAMNGYFDLPGGPAQQCAQAICAVFNGTSSVFPGGTLHCIVTQTGTNRFKLTFSGDVPLGGFFNLCYSNQIASRLAVRLVGGNVEVSWTGVGALEEANHPAGPWRDVAPAPVLSPHFEPALAQTKFYRLRKE